LTLAVVDYSLNKFTYVKGALVRVADGRVTISSPNKTVAAYSVTPTVAVYRANTPMSLTDLQPGTPVLLLLTGPRGRADYIEAMGP